MIFSQDIGIDLGTTNTAVCVKSKGVVLHEPSVVAVDIKNTPPRVVAVGEEAKRMVGRTPGSITAVRPVKESIIGAADYVQYEQEIVEDKRKRGKKVDNDELPFMNMIFTGGPGTGKTSIAKLTAKYAVNVAANSDEILSADGAGVAVGG